MTAIYTYTKNTRVFSGFAFTSFSVNKIFGVAILNSGFIEIFFLFQLLYEKIP